MIGLLLAPGIYALTFLREINPIAIYPLKSGVGIERINPITNMQPQKNNPSGLVKSTRALAWLASLLLLAVLLAGPSAQAQTPLVQLKAANYNATSGVWTDTSGNGNNATATGTKPTLATGVTPNGSSAVVFSGSNPMGLATSIPVGSYTVFAYIKPTSGGGAYAMLGGASGAFEYRINANKQDDLRQQQADLGSETTALSTTAFSTIDTILTSSGINFRLNGSADGTNAVSTALTQPISAIGARASSGGENFSGSICEIDIYSGVLTPAQISTIEQTISAAYDAAPAVASDTAASPNPATINGNDTLSASFSGAIPLSYQWFVSPNADGSSSNSITGATNTTLTLTNLQLPDSGKYYSLRATNTVSPYSAYSTWLKLNVVALTPMVQLIATNYNPSSGVWLDTSGNNNSATNFAGTLPTLATFVTPNGGSAVNIASGGSSFQLASTLSPGSGYTVFAYVKPSSTSGRNALTGGNTSDALEYDIFNGKQDYLREYNADVAEATTNIPTTSFSLIDLAVNSSGATFRYNGVPDSNTVAGATFTQPISRFGNNHGSGDSYVGQIAEIDVYSGVLTYPQITNIEAQLTAKYITANSVVVGAATVSPTNNTFDGNSVTLSAPVLGATPTTTYRWQTDNGSLGASFANIAGANTTNFYVLNTTSLAPSSATTYEYRLIVTPFGGNAVTSAPVNLTVQPASAPLVLVDAAPVTATVGGNATFSAAFVGNLPIGYQWQVSANSSGSPATSITGATNSTLTLTNVQLSDSGNYYSLRATNTVLPYAANSSWVQLTVVPLTPMVQLIAANYTVSGATWHDSSGNGNDAYYAGSTPPTVVPIATPNGSAALDLLGSGGFSLTSSLDPSLGYTVFAYLMPTNTTGRHALTGGSYGSGYALEYDIYNGQQDYLVEYQSDNGHGTATIPTNSFSLIDLAVNSAGAAFRLNGASDGSVVGATFSQPITRIGNNTGLGDNLVGQVAEIDVYQGALTYNQITNVEAQLTAKYLTANSVVVGAATVAPTNNVYDGTAVTLGAPVIGATGTTTYRWQTDNGSSGVTFTDIGGAITTNYVLNTTGLAPTTATTYELQLIATPFGGNSVTSAPVNLTVEPPSAPVVSVDATPVTATVGGNATFSAAFVGNLPIGYQWQVSAYSDGSSATSITGATNTTLTLTNVQLSGSGFYYSLRATNPVAPYAANSSWALLTVEPLTPMVQLIATNYDPSSGVWLDTSGNNNSATNYNVTHPTLASSVTPNGGSAVNIASSGSSFQLMTSLAPDSGYTVFAYVMPTNLSGRAALVGGEAYDALEYDFYNGHQDYLYEGHTDVGHGTATIPTTSFSLVDLAVNSFGAAFRLNGAPDGSVGGQTFTAPITRIANNGGFGNGPGGDGLLGQIAEIDIYSNVLSYVQITNIEAQLTAKYVTSSVATNPTNITAVVTGGTTLSITWPGDHRGWTLQTNSVDLSNPSDWFPYPGSTTVTNVNITIQPNQPNVFFRLKY